MVNNTIKKGRKPVKTPAASAWYKGKRLRKLDENYKKTALVIRLIIATGIRTSELPNLTVEAVQQGYMESKFFRSIRKILIPPNLCELLLKFANEQGITSGSIFLTTRGLPCDRNAMFHAFGKLAAATGIAPERLTSDALRKYYHDKHTEENNVATVQSSLGYRTVNYYVEYEPKNEDILSKNLDEMLDL